MSLTEKYGSPLSLFLSLSPKKRRSAGVRLSTKPSFEEALIVRLRSLLPIPDCSRSVPLLWLSRAVDLLSITLADAVAIISDPSLSTADRDALSSHLDSSVALLDACNAITAAADRILRGRLLVCLAIHLISSTPSLSPDLRRRARSAIAEWETVVSAPLSQSFSGSTDFTHRLKQPKDPNRGRLTAVRRAIYAVEAISDLVARSTLAALGEKAKGDDDGIMGIRASGEFPWAAAYNEVVAAVSAKLYRGKRAGEIEVAEQSVRRIAAAVVCEGEGEEEELRNAVSGAERAMEELTEGMEELTEGVNKLFHRSLETREAALECFRRVGLGKCV